MHLSMHNWMRAEPIDVTIRRLAKYGYESIEIGGEPDKYDTNEVRGLLNDNGIRCWGSISLMFTGLDLIQADEKGRANTVQYLKDCVTMVKELDGHVMSIVPSNSLTTMFSISSLMNVWVLSGQLKSRLKSSYHFCMVARQVATCI